MKQRFLMEAGLAVLALGALASFFSGPAPTTPPAAAHDGADDGHEHDEHASAGAEPSLHALPPRNVELEITEGTWLRAPGAAWFAKQAELEPGRFSQDANGNWFDAQGEYSYFEDPVEGEWAYWQWLSPQRLTRGRQHFIQYCASCHGLNGDGLGRSGQHLRPPPRSFHQSNFKFTKVLENLPTDQALLGLIKRGLNGTPMYPWALQDSVILDIIQYIKFLSPPEMGWRDVYTEIGDPVEVTPDPWVGKETQARGRGEAIYHGQAGCHACHPGYVTSSKLADIRGDAAGTKYRDNLSYPELKESNYTVQEKQIYFLPPDFTWHELRAGSSLEELFGTIASGIKGTAMPQWKGSIPDEDIWAMSYYVKGLIDDYKGKPARTAFMAGLRSE